MAHALKLLETVLQLPHHILSDTFYSASARSLQLSLLTSVHPYTWVPTVLDMN